MLSLGSHNTHFLFVHITLTKEKREKDYNRGTEVKSTERRKQKME